MNTNPLVSIIVPVYGTEQFLSKCIDSILAQTYRNTEIILVDDKSPDNCPEICDTYAQKYERIVVIHQENKGVSGARNTGILRSSGEYIIFVDSDDELYPNAVQTMLDDIISYGADIVSAAETLTVKNGNAVNNGDDGNYYFYSGDEPLLLSLNGQRNCNSVHCKFFRKEFIDNLFFTEGKNIQEDGFFLFQSFLRKPVFVQHNVLVYHYNHRDDSCSRDSFSDKYLSMLYFCKQKKHMISEMFPQYMDNAYNMEVRTNLQLLDLMCRTTKKKYDDLQKQCIKTVKALYKYHCPINKHYKQLALIVKCGFYPLYKRAVRMKYHM